MHLNKLPFCGPSLAYTGVVAAFFLAGSALVAGDSFVWINRTPCPLLRFEAVGGVAAGKLYQFSGYYTINPIKATVRCDAYDPATNAWTRLADIPQAISHSGQAVDDQPADDQTFWLVGGFLGDHPGPSTNQVWKYSIKNNSWSAGPPLPDQRAGGALVKLGRELHFFGGVIRTNDVYIRDYGTHWAIDLDGGTAWRATTPGGQTLTPMPNPRNHTGGIALNGKLYAIGGQHLGDEQSGTQSEVDVYDPVTNSWTLAAPMPRPISHDTANIFVRDGRIVVASGVTNNSVDIANVIEYDPATNSWSELPALPSSRQSPVAGLVGDSMVVTCGLQGSAIRAQTWVSTPVGVIPAPWDDQDIGTVGVAGDASSSDYSSSFSLAGSGDGIANSADSFNYLYQPLNGNGQIVVKVATQENTSLLAQAGVMIRESLDSGSKHAAMLITPGKGAFFQRRTATNGTTSQNVKTGSGIVAPYWLKLVRSGSKLTGYHSSTGTSWTQLGSATISMASSVWIGLAVSSSANATVSTANFTNINIGPKANAGADSRITFGSSIRLDGSGIDDGLPAGTLRYTWKVISGPGTVTFANGTAASTSATFSASGVYTLRLTVSDSKLTATDDVVVSVDPTSATTQRYLYAAVAGGGLKVYDIDNGHALVKTLQPVSTNGELRGICASAVTGRLYASYRTGRMYSLDLLTDQLIFDRSYPPDVDRMDINAEGTRIYMPLGENRSEAYDNVIDAMSGAIIAQVQVASKTHDTLCSETGPRAYLESVTSTYVSVVDTNTNQITRRIGPFGDSVRPFVFNADETLMYANTNNLFGFEIANMTSGEVIYHVPITGVNYTPQITPSHGLGLTPDGKELWVCDSTNAYIHVFNVSQLPPTQIASVPLSGGTTHWVTFSVDGRFAYTSGPHFTTKPIDVIDTRTKQKVASIASSREILEVDFDGGKVVKVGKQYGVGRN
ncbi:MAG: DUF1349 domain-containing protein [Chthoniobacterales bacterium]|nr:DUF1349 domain-containing protein [Chthoniobacterales bacterium]